MGFLSVAVSIICCCTPHSIHWEIHTQMFLLNEKYPVLKIKPLFFKVGGGKSTYVVHMFRNLLQEEGPLGLTKGLSARMLSVVPSSVVMVLGYETVKRLSLKTSEVDMLVQEEGYLEASF